SSDVCSSDLVRQDRPPCGSEHRARDRAQGSGTDGAHVGEPGGSQVGERQRGEVGMNPSNVIYRIIGLAVLTIGALVYLSPLVLPPDVPLPSFLPREPLHL